MKSPEGRCARWRHEDTTPAPNPYRIHLRRRGIDRLRGIGECRTTTRRQCRSAETDSFTPWRPHRADYDEGAIHYRPGDHSSGANIAGDEPPRDHCRAGAINYGGRFDHLALDVHGSAGASGHYDYAVHEPGHNSRHDTADRHQRPSGNDATDSDLRAHATANDAHDRRYNANDRHHATATDVRPNRASCAQHLVGRRERTR